MIKRQERDMFSRAEIDAAKRRLAKYPRQPITPAIRFHTALRALIMDANRNQKQESSNAVLALDSVEIIAYAAYSQSDYTAFTLSGLVTDNADPDWNSELEQLDKLISHWLVKSDSRPFVLLDSYAREIQDVWDAIQNRRRKTAEKLLSSEEMLSNALEFSPDALKRIRDFITSRNTDKAALEELKRFRDDFMPGWSMKIIDSLVGHRTTITRLQDFFSTKPYVYLRGPDFDSRSVAHALPGFDWGEFQDFVADEKVAAEFQSVHATIAELAGIPRFGRNKGATTIVAENDALAFADIHTVNTFLRKSGRQERVELVSRSSLLADILRALPSGRLDVPLRHPLLLPDAFEFDESALSAITEISQKFDAVLSPYLEDYEPGVSEDGDVNEGGEATRENRDLEQAKAIARDLVRWLRDATVAQVSIKQNALNKVVFQSTRGPSAAQETDTINVIREIFDALISRLEDPNNPFTTSTLKDLALRNRDMATVIWERVMTGRPIRARTLKIDSEKLTPVPLMGVRFIDCQFTRLFYLHSDRAKELLEKKFRENTSADERPDRHQEVEIELTRRDTLDQFTRLLDSLADPTESDQDRCYLYDITLLVCAAFASRGEMTTAASLASTVLHQVSTVMRQPEYSLSGMDEGEKLALQELFLFRQYCERSMAISNYFKNRSHPTIEFLRGLLEKDFARAQRDLDRAAELDALLEDAEASELVRSVRLRLIHMSGWMDMYLMTDSIDIELKYDWPTRPLLKVGNRRDIWSAVGYTKECQDDLRRIRALKKSCDHGNEIRRFLSHLEARILQNIIVMFLVLLFSKHVPLMDRVLRADHRVVPEHMLKFVGFEKYWSEFNELVNHYRFEFRIRKIVELVLRALLTVKAVREEEINDTLKREKSIKEWSQVWEQLENGYQGRPESGFSDLLAKHIATGLRSKVLPSDHHGSALFEAT